MQSLPRDQQRRQLDTLAALNKLHNEQRGHDSSLEARIHSFELAYRMQMEAADAFDVSREPKEVLEAYGPGVQARQILIARRLVERGVRFVQLWHGAGQPWDNHDDIEVNHRTLAGQCDRAIAALLSDLKRLGLFEETLVICGGEFGRTPDRRTASSGCQCRQDQRPRSQSLGIHRLAGRRRRQRGTGLWRHRRVRLQGGGKPGPRPRPACHDSEAARDSTIRV